jgi:hypothetical protein
MTREVREGAENLSLAVDSHAGAQSEADEGRRATPSKQQLFHRACCTACRLQQLTTTDFFNANRTLAMARGTPT